MSQSALLTAAPAEFARLAHEVERELTALIDEAPASYGRLSEAMAYAALGGGKRLRAWLVAATGRLFDADAPATLRTGAAIELIHAYSLIHDDLPAMDDAPVRRGKASCHKAFDEATAILAGDALQALAFEALAREDWPATDVQRLTLIRDLAHAAGLHGMCGGQTIDLQAEHRALDLTAITELQNLKTGALFRFACRAGGILGRAEQAELAALDDFAQALGLAFQIKDDLLDLVGDAAAMGKAAGQDAVRGKATFPSILGIEGARQRLVVLRQEARQALIVFGPSAQHLRTMLDYVIDRES